MAKKHNVLYHLPLRIHRQDKTANIDSLRKYETHL